MIKTYLALLLFNSTLLLGDQIQTMSKLKGVLSEEDLNRFKHEFNLCSFIETGTYAGDTTAVASQVFDQVYSIDIYEPIFKQAQKRFAQSKNIHLYFGDTCNLLKQMIKDSPARRLYWLDAHCSGGGTGGLAGFCPISQELVQIFEHDADDFVILIDDLRGMCHCDARTNLLLREIIREVKEFDPDLEFYSIGDIAIIFKAKNHEHTFASELVKSASISRFFDPDCQNEDTLNELIDAETVISSIGRCTSEEENFRKLFKFVDNKDAIGGEIIYLLWESLGKLKEGDYLCAIADLQLISTSFYSHWRIDAYLTKALALEGRLEEAQAIFQEKLQGIYTQFPQILRKILEESYERVVD